MNESLRVTEKALRLQAAVDAYIAGYAALERMLMEPRDPDATVRVADVLTQLREIDRQASIAALGF